MRLAKWELVELAKQVEEIVRDGFPQCIVIDRPQRPAEICRAMLARRLFARASSVPRPILGALGPGVLVFPNAVRLALPTTQTLVPPRAGPSALIQSWTLGATGRTKWSNSGKMPGPKLLQRQTTVPMFVPSRQGNQIASALFQWLFTSSCTGAQRPRVILGWVATNLTRAQRAANRM